MRVTHSLLGMVKSFHDKRTAAIFQGEMPKRFAADVFAVAVWKLRFIHRAQNLNDLRNPPGNRLEIVRGDCAGQHTIRIYDQWRICFV